MHISYQYVCVGVLAGSMFTAIWKLETYINIISIIIITGIDKYKHHNYTSD